VFANADIAAIMGLDLRNSFGGVLQTIVADWLGDLTVVTDYGGRGRI
jgi:hypothetical protein